MHLKLNFSNKREEAVPVVIFCYTRINNLKKLIRSLQKCPEASETPLIIYSDGFRDEHDKAQVKRVRHYLRTITGFQSVKIVERAYNYNIEKNIVDGITETLRDFECVIVLEDDGEVAHNFISFMRHALKYYSASEDVMHVGTFTFLNLKINRDQVFFWRYCENTAGGWGTWRSSWEQFVYYPSWHEIEKNIPNAENLLYEIGGDLILKSFDRECVPWDVCWLLTVSSMNGVSVHTPHSLVKNNGYKNGSHFNWSNVLYEGFVYRAKFKKNSNVRLIPYVKRDKTAEKQLFAVFEKLAKNAKIRSKMKATFTCIFYGLLRTNLSEKKDTKR